MGANSRLNARRCMNHGLIVMVALSDHCQKVGMRKIPGRPKTGSIGRRSNSSFRQGRSLAGVSVFAEAKQTQEGALWSTTGRSGGEKADQENDETLCRPTAYVKLGNQDTNQIPQLLPKKGLLTIAQPQAAENPAHLAQRTPP